MTFNDHDMKCLQGLLNELGEGEAELDDWLGPITQFLHAAPHRVAMLRELFRRATSHGDRNDILMAFYHYANSQIAPDLQLASSAWQRCRYELLRDEGRLEVVIPAAGREQWQTLLEVLRYGDEPCRLTAHGVATPLPEDVALLFAMPAGADLQLVVEVGASLVCRTFTPEAICFSLESSQNLEMRELFEYLAFLGVILDRPVRIVPAGRPEQAICAFDPQRNRFTLSPEHCQAPVGEGVASCPAAGGESARGRAGADPG